MSETGIFEYTHHESFLSRLKPGFKLASLLLLCIATAILPPLYLILPAALILPLILTSGKSVKKQFASLWKLFIFFAITGFVKFITSGSVIESAALTLRMIFMMISGVLFYSSTRLSELRRSLLQLFSRIPVINGARIAELSAMAISFLPLIFKTLNELQNARTSRCFKPGKNLLRTIKVSSIPLMINMFLKTDEMADAWYSRGYNPPDKDNH